MTAPLRLATRKSQMALAQTEQVAALLQQTGMTTQLLPLSTKGDEILDRPLAEVGGKALFIKGLEVALLSDQADMAVHSMKDVPADLDSRFAIVAVLARPTAFDAFVSDQYVRLTDLPAGAIVGSSSPRRHAQLKLYRPDLQIRPVRGNVVTRMQKMRQGEFDALILSAAGLARINRSGCIQHVLNPPDFVPAAGQGAICVEVLRERLPELGPLLSVLNDQASYQATGAEREMVKALQGDCHSPIAAYAVCNGNRINLTGCVMSVSAQKIIHATEEADVGQWQQLGRSVAQCLNDQGAQQLLGLK